ncbi:cyclase family protein, partial [Halorussus sp. GCM10023401]
VVRTGWDAHWGTDRYFDHPYLDREAAAWCADRGLSVGLDALSPDPTPSSGGNETSETERAEAKSSAEPDGVPAHRELLGGGQLVVENLCDLGGLPDRFEVRAYPLALSGADGAPVRAVAVW